MGGTINIMNPVSVTGSTLPAMVWLGPAIPNPTRSETQFQFGLPRRSQVDFAVFDARGREVRVLARGEMAAGTHSMRWNGRVRGGNLAPSGPYFFRLKVEGQSYSGRFVLLR
jgi:flagellar hook assembly protein FlgD